jgi:hypothetical protein
MNWFRSISAEKRLGDLIDIQKVYHNIESTGIEAWKNQ